MSEKSNTQDITKEYLKASIHLGHKPNEWNPKMAPYILHEKYGYHIFDIVKTSKMLKIAGNMLEKKAGKGGKFLFVGTDKISSSIVEKQAIRSDSFYMNYRWLGGMFTNWITLQKRITRFKMMEEQFKMMEEKENSGGFKIFSKKELSTKKKELKKLKRFFNGIKEMKSLPDAVIFSNQYKDTLAIQECIKLGIPTICIVDSNGNPDLVPYPIPANNDSSSSISFLLNYLSKRILAGSKKNINRV